MALISLISSLNLCVIKNTVGLAVHISLLNNILLQILCILCGIPTKILSLYLENIWFSIILNTQYHIEGFRVISVFWGHNILISNLFKLSFHSSLSSQMTQSSWLVSIKGFTVSIKFWNWNNVFYAPCRCKVSF